jgi:hypothetical protein
MKWVLGIFRDQGLEEQGEKAEKVSGTLQIGRHSWPRWPILWHLRPFYRDFHSIAERAGDT